MSDSIVTLQELVRARVDGDTFLDGITIVSEATANIEATIDAQLEATGLVGVVLAPSISKGGMPRAFRVDFEITLIELVAKNRDDGSLIAASAAAVAVMERLSNWQPSSSWTRMVVESCELLSAVPLLIYQVTASTQILSLPSN